MDFDTNNIFNKEKSLNKETAYAKQIARQMGWLS